MDNQPGSPSSSSTPPAAADLVHRLINCNPTEFATLTEELKVLGDSAVSALLQALPHLESAPYWQCLHALRGMGEAGAQAMRTAATDADPALRCAAVHFITLTRNPREAPVLAALLQDRTGAIRREAATALAQFKPTCFSILKQALDSPNARLRQAAMWGVAQCSDPEMAEPLVRVLKEGSPQQRALAAAALHRIDDPDVVPPLLQALEDPSPQVRARAADALGREHEERVVQPLARALRDPHPSVSFQASCSLGKTLLPQALQPLVDALKDPTLKRGADAVWGLGYLGTPEALAHLADALDYDWIPQRELLYVVAEFGPASIPILLQALEREQPEMRLMAASHLLRAGHLPPALDALSSLLSSMDAFLRTGAAVALVDVRPAGVAVLMRALQDPDPLTRRAAVGAMAARADRFGEAHFHNFLNDPDPYVRRSARRALRELQD